MWRLSKDELYDLYWNRGLSACEIAKIYSVGGSTVYLWMRKYGIKRRSLSEASWLRYRKARDISVEGDFVRPSREELWSLYWDKGLSTLEIARIYGVCHATVCNWMKEYNIESKSLSDAQNMRFKKEVDREIKEKFNKPMPELAYVLGVMLGDGSCYRYRNIRKGEVVGYHYEIRLGTVDYPFAEKFKKALEKIGLNATIRVKKSKNKNWRDVYVATSYSRAFYEFYKSLSIEDVKRIITGFEPYFVCGFYESEGSVVYHKVNRYLVIKISNTNHEIIKTIYDIVVNKFGIKCYLHVEKNRPGRRKPLYRLRIQGNERCKRFLEIINPVIKNRPKNVVK